MPAASRSAHLPYELRLVDAHTHTSGPQDDGPVEDIVKCLDECGVEQAFMFAPMVNVHGWDLTSQHLDDIRRHDDYISHLCSFAPDRLLAFAVLNPNPAIADGDQDKAVELMIEEARRCYHELGIRGVKMVPDHWRVNDPRVLPLLRELASLGMYVAFHSGIFLDERASDFCRPASYENVHLVPGFHGHLAHLGWPWVDECIATLGMQTFHRRQGRRDPWQMKADLSFGCPPDWQLESLRKALDYLPHDMLMYASDVFWPCDRRRYMEEFVYPQWANFEAAATISSSSPGQGTDERMKLRQGVFHDNALEHWRVGTRGKPQQLQRMKLAPGAPRAFMRPSESAQRMRSPAVNQREQVERQPPQ